jgi:hypothetical protein
MHAAVTIALAVLMAIVSLTVAWYWWKSSQVDIGITSVSIDDVPQAHIMDAQAAIIESSRLNRIAAGWTTLAAPLSAATSISGAFS